MDKVFEHKVEVFRFLDTIPFGFTFNNFNLPDPHTRKFTIFLEFLSSDIADITELSKEISNYYDEFIFTRLSKYKYKIEITHVNTEEISLNFNLTIVNRETHNLELHVTGFTEEGYTVEDVKYIWRGTCEKVYDYNLEILNTVEERLSEGRYPVGKGAFDLWEKTKTRGGIINYENK